MPTRDLTVNIDGDPAGFDAAFKAAEEEAKGLDRELAKLTKTQTAQERVTARTAAAVRKYGTEQGKAALAARKLGTEAEKAAERAEKATERADKAAEAYKKGLIDEARAAHLAARAEDAIERAALKAVEAHRAAARAAKEQAEAERRLALEAAAQHLSELRSVGAVDEHNATLRRLRREYGDLEKTAVGGFREMEHAASGAFGLIRRGGTAAFEGVSSAASSLAETGPGVIALIVAGLGAVPFAALAAETAITAGVGGGLAALGLMATKSDAQVQAALHRTASHVKSETKQIAAPFKQTWLEIATDAREAFDSIEPELASDFDQLAPAISRFVHAGAGAVHELDPALHAATVGTTRLADALGGRLPSITHSLASAITIMGNSVANNADDFANLAANTAKILPYLAAFLDYSVQLGHVVSPLFDALTAGTGTVNSLEHGLSWLSGGMLHLGTSAKKTGRSDLPAYSDGADQAAASSSKLDKDMRTLASDTASATDKANALTDAFQRLLNPQQAVFTDTAKLKQGIKDLSAALKKSHGSLGDNTQAARAARDAFSGLLDNAKSLAGDMLSSHKSIEQVRASLNPYIHSLYEAAGGNKQARALVDAFVRSLDKVPPKKGTKLTLDDREFLAKLHAAQGLHLDPKTGYLRGNNADYFNKWLKANHLKLDPKTGKFLGNNADYYNKWLKANHLHIDTKTGVIKGNTSAFWNAVHAIPKTVAYRKIGVYYVPVNSANEPGHSRHSAHGGFIHRADGGPVGMADGGPSGMVAGPGTATSDSIPAMLSNGEYVINAAATAIYRPLLDAINYGRGRVPVSPVPARGGDGAATGPPVTQVFETQPMDVHQLARESARELAWTLRG